MKINISEILKSSILLEGRLEDVKAKYPGHEELIDLLAQEDPSGNNKYLAWMVKHAIGKGQDTQIPTADLIVDTVKNFDVSGDRLKKEGKSFDINSYKSVQQVIDTLNSLKRRDAPSKSQLKGNGDLIYNGEDVFVIAPRNWEGSCKFGAGARWCIAQTSTNSHWNSYTKSNMFYFVTSKNLPSSDKNYKIAIQKNLTSGKNTYWDVPDTSSSTPQNPEIDETVLAVIDDHFVKAKKTIFKRLLEDMLAGVKSTLSNDNFSRVKELANDNQLYKLVLTKPEFLLGGNNVNTFKYVLGRLGEKHMYKLLTSNYEELIKLLNSEDILSFLDENTTREQKLELSKNLNDYLKTASPKVSIKIDKWGLSDEEWEKYNSSSSYLYLTKDEETLTPTSKIYKIDRFDEKSRVVLSQLKLKLRFKDGSMLVGVSTGKDELDEYTDMEPNEIPNEVLEKHKRQIIRPRN